MVKTERVEHWKKPAVTAPKKAPRYYPAEDVKGNRVVVLKQLDSGLLLVTGPYKVNGVPLRRMNQAYTIATSTRISVDGVDVSGVDDAFFARANAGKGNDEAAFFAQGGESKAEVSDDRKAMQKK